jgi:predicted TIM-barrel fold metal-dependent hydrolase
MQHELYDDLPIVDAHHHLWDLEGPVHYPWLTQPDPHHS